jgi:hypothetical protein
MNLTNIRFKSIDHLTLSISQFFRKKGCDMMLTIDVTNKINETSFEDMFYEIQDIVKSNNFI